MHVHGSLTAGEQVNTRVTRKSLPATVGRAHRASLRFRAARAGFLISRNAAKTALVGHVDHHGSTMPAVHPKRTRVAPFQDYRKITTPRLGDSAQDKSDRARLSCAGELVPTMQLGRLGAVIIQYYRVARRPTLSIEPGWRPTTRHRRLA